MAILRNVLKRPVSEAVRNSEKTPHTRKPVPGVASERAAAGVSLREKYPLSAPAHRGGHYSIFRNAVCLFLLLFLPVVSHADYFVTLQAVYTGNTEADLRFGNNFYYAGEGQESCLRSELYRGDNLIAQHGYGTMDYTENGLTKGASHTYTVKAYDKCLKNEYDQPVERLVKQKSIDVTAGMISGTINRDMIWSGDTWNITGAVYLNGKSLAIQGGAVVEKTGSSGISLYQGSSVTINGATLRNIGIGADYNNIANTIIRVSNSTLEGNVYLRAETFSIFSNNVLSGYTGQLAFTPNNATLDIRNYQAPDVPVTVAWNTGSPPVSVTFENNTFKSLQIGSPSTGDTAPITVKNNTIKEQLSVAHGSGPVTIADNTLTSLSVTGTVSGTQTPKNSKADFNRFITGNTITPPKNTGSPVYGIYHASSEFYVESNTITCEDKSAIGISMRPLSTVNWILLNTVSRCAFGLSFEADYFGGKIASNLVKENTFLGYNNPGDAQQGIRLNYETRDNIIQGNMIKGYLYGLHFFQISSNPTRIIENNIFSENIIEDNATILSMSGGVKNNLFYDNIFKKRDGTDNSDMFEIFGSSSCKDSNGYYISCTNIWNQTKATGNNIIGGSYIGGNYWSAYTGDDADRDGIGDAPYWISSAEKDNYPLVFDILVNNTGDEDDADPDDGKCDTNLSTAGDQCTLRAAITEANRRQGRNTISFNIPGTGAPVIRPKKPLPSITDQAAINGATQPGGLVIIDGTDAGAGVDGIYINSTDAGPSFDLKSLVLQNFKGSGIVSQNKLRLTNVKAIDNNGNGVMVANGVEIEGKDNHFSRNGGKGLYALSRGINAGNGVIQAENNTGHGIYVEEGPVRINHVVDKPAYTGETSRINGNGKAGIYVASTPSIDQGPGSDSDEPFSNALTATCLEVSGNGKAGADHKEQSGIYAKGIVSLGFVKVTGNAGFGVYAYSSISILYNNNHFSRNGLIGLYSEVRRVKAFDAVIQVENNGSYGIWAAVGPVTINYISGKSAYMNQTSRINGNGKTGIYVHVGAGSDSGPEPGNDEPFGEALLAKYIEVIGNGSAGSDSNSKEEQSGIYAKGIVDLGFAKVTDNTGYGVYAIASIFIHHNNNHFSRNGTVGLFSETRHVKAFDAVIQVENNGSFGILVEKGSVTINSVAGKSSYAFETSRIKGNGKTGIYASRDEGYRPDPEGLYPDATGHLTATCIEVIGNGSSGTTDKQKSGIYAEGKVNLTLAKVTDNKGPGVYTRKDVTIQGEENTFSGNAGIGIHSWEGSVDASWGVIKVENNGSYGIATDRGFVSINWNSVASKAFYDNEFSTIRGNGKSGIKTLYNNTYSAAGLSGTINGNYIHITGNTSSGIDAGNDVTLRHGDVCNNTGGNVSVKGTIYVNDVNLCDADMDGVSDLIEAAGPNNGDGNNDGVADALQKEVATLKTLMGKYSTITFLPEGESPAVWVSAPGEFPYGSHQGVSFQSGVVSVTADVSRNKVLTPLDLSNTTIFRIEHIIHDAGPVNTYWIYGPTVQDPVPHWYEFPFDGTTGAIINGNKVTLYIADGGRGDADLLKNGRASFLGAPGSLADHSMISITLNQGWNFISLPSQPLIPATHSVLHDIIDNVRIVWGYDNGAKKWLRFKKLAAGTEDPIDLATMETGPGYWIYANGAVTFSLPCLDVSPNIALTEGWNLVGYYGQEGRDVYSALQGLSDDWLIVWEWDHGEWKSKLPPASAAVFPMLEFTNFRKGKAYWIKMKTAAAWQQ